MAARLSVGLALAGLAVVSAIAEFQAGNMALGWVFVGAFVAVCALTVAPRVRLLHRLPPPLGAIPPPGVTFSLEGHAGMSFKLRSATEDAVILRVRIQNDERDEIPKAHVNAEVVGSTQIRRCLQDGGRHLGKGTMMREDGLYWYEPLEIPPQTLNMYFQVDLPGPGTYPVVFKLWSSSFYKKGDHDYLGEIQALPPESGGAS